jgi:GTP 3',8-cyclase
MNANTAVPSCAIPARVDAVDADERAPAAGGLDCLRVALTDACNPRCVHCQEETVGLSPRHFLLTDEQIIRLIRLFVEMGFREVRFTGEPTLRSSLVELVRETAQMPGVRLVSMATNGTGLEALAQPLKRAGLGKVDLVIEPYHSVALGGRLMRCGGLRDVFHGINAVARAGLPLKIFSGACRELCERGELLELARLTLRHSWDVRYVEQPLPLPARRMPSLQAVPRESVLKRLRTHFGSLDWLPGSDPASGLGRFKLPGGKGTLGFVSSADIPLEAQCNLLRLTAAGDLRRCQIHRDELSLRMLLHNGASDELLKIAIGSALAADNPADRERTTVGGVARAISCAPDSSSCQKSAVPSS